AAGLRDPHVPVAVALDRVPAAVHRVDAALAGTRVDPEKAGVVVDDAVRAELEVVAARARGRVAETVLVHRGAEHVAGGRGRKRQLWKDDVRPEHGEQVREDQWPRLRMIRRQVAFHRRDDLWPLLGRLVLAEAGAGDLVAVAAREREISADGRA